MSDENKGFDALKLMRDTRDGTMDAWAKMMLRMTSSHEYHRLQGMISKPALLAIALFKNVSETTMATLLGNLNMPSREEVLQLSKRLTHIEMAIDDLAAGMDQLRRMATANRSGRGPRERDGGASDARPAQEA